MTAKSPSLMEMERASFEAWAKENVSSPDSAYLEFYWSIWLAARERPDEVVVARGEYSDKTGDVLVGGFVECRILLTAPNADKMTKFDGQHVAVVVRKSEGGK